MKSFEKNSSTWAQNLAAWLILILFRQPAISSSLVYQALNGPINQQTAEISLKTWHAINRYVPHQCPRGVCQVALTPPSMEVPWHPPLTHPCQTCEGLSEILWTKFHLTNTMTKHLRMLSIFVQASDSVCKCCFSITSTISFKHAIQQTCNKTCNDPKKSPKKNPRKAWEAPQLSPTPLSTPRFPSDASEISQSLRLAAQSCAQKRNLCRVGSFNANHPNTPPQPPTPNPQPPTPNQGGFTSFWAVKQKWLSGF